MSTVLVTGGAGYIGSHTVRMLVEKNHKVIVLDNLVYGHAEAIIDEEVELVKGDIGDESLLKSLFEKHKFDAVLHFAAYAYVGESVSHPHKYYVNNVAKPLTLLKTMVDHGCLKFIFSSTCATYGNPEYMPLDEKHPQRPVSPYGKSKYLLEEIIKDYEVAYNLRYVFLRYFNASGGAEDGKIGEDHDPETHLIPLILDAINGDRPAIKVFGTDYDTPDGTAVRDYIHVSDLGDAHIKALEYLDKGSESIACNLGTGVGYSVKEVIDAAAEVTGKEVPTEYAERRQGDATKLIADAQLALDKLGWDPKYKDVKEIIKTAWAWKSGERKGRY
ncbi:MAG: UDP-glucose 4-epimerase GalE [Marinoscillum sp.]